MHSGDAFSGDKQCLYGKEWKADIQASEKHITLGVKVVYSVFIKHIV